MMMTLIVFEIWDYFWKVGSSIRQILFQINHPTVPITLLITVQVDVQFIMRRNFGGKSLFSFKGKQRKKLRLK